jgi:hypothetical protein
MSQCFPQTFPIDANGYPLCDARGYFMTNGSFQSVSGPYPLESDVVWPYVDSANPAKQTMDFVGHDLTTGYSKFRLIITKPPTTSDIIGVYVDAGGNAGNNYPYTSNPPISGSGKLCEYIHFATMNEPQRVLEYSFTTPCYAYNNYSTSDTHAIVVVVVTRTGYRAFCHYAVAKQWINWSVDLTTIFASTDGGSTYNAVTNLTLPWLPPTAAIPIMNRYRFTFNVSHLGGGDENVRIGIRKTNPTGQIMISSQDVRVAGSLPQTVSLELSSEVLSPDGLSYQIDPRKPTQYCCPALMPPTWSTYASYNTGVTNPTLVHDWYAPS